MKIVKVSESKIFDVYECVNEDRSLGTIHQADNSDYFVFSPFICGEDLDGEDCGNEISMEEMK